MSLKIDMKMILLVKFSEPDCNFPIICWILQMIVTVVNLQLEFHRMSINSVQFIEKIVVWNSLNLLFPRFNRIASHFSQAKHRVGEDLDFDSGKLLSSTV